MLGGAVIGCSVLLGQRWSVSLLLGAGTSMLLLLVWIVLARLSHARASEVHFPSAPAGQKPHQRQLSCP
jgi:hypothetical protein